MAGELAGTTITITTTKSTTPQELGELVVKAFAATTHPHCASGAHVTAREAKVHHTEPAGTIAIS